MLEIVPVEEAVGKILSHDITRIVPGELKERAYKKGHMITDEDVPKLKQLGKDHIYILNLAEGLVHENLAAERIARAICGPFLGYGEPNQGKIELTSELNGLLKINIPLLQKLNEIPDVTIATRLTNQPVGVGSTVAGTRIIPLFTQEENLLRLESLCSKHPPLISIKPFQPWRIGLITTGTEVFYGRIPDGFGPIVKSKFEAMGSEVYRQDIVPDEIQVIAAAINEQVSEGAQMVVLTGGMSVDPDDLTPAAIRATGARVITYGAPTYPGAMFMMAELDGTPIIGLPGCTMYHKATIFELVVTRLLAGETVTRSDIVALGHGGICAGCQVCHYPNCGFGKG
ncbi:molybdopterin-binding domain protein, putative [Syntrophotalea carbinolica DSM 2380]|uniref:Molybdopterin molybdenumtransferase n=1 Tax=Syntrophotalea carbinolica (strain DSM 2380 / NBRC 103641 / GraBd1) TaxID=338963 RepID=Q3A812_SYNC1|nr:molybdopterin-binding protein [Syntrophotalea carbinolica]ABA87480.1 molybdopterin-binding domain protein, putative [Syntrophotalea carbinolica DSM 2380]